MTCLKLGRPLSLFLILISLFLCLSNCSDDSSDGSTNDVLFPPDSLTCYAGNNSITLLWGSVSSANKYYIYRGINSNTEQMTLVDVVDTTGFEDVGLAYNNTYYYALKSGNENAQSLFSDVDSLLLLQLPTPQDLLGVRNGDSITISWSTDSSTQGTLYYQNQSDITEESFSIDVEGKEHIIYPAIDSLNYYFAIQGKKGSRLSALSDEICVSAVIKTPDTLATPNKLTAIPSLKSVLLHWETVDTNVQFKIYYNTKGSVTSSDQVLEVGQNEFLHENCSPDTTYYYRVISYLDTLESVLSNEVSATPLKEIIKPETPQNIVAIAGDSQVNVHWNEIKDVHYKLWFDTTNTFETALDTSLVDTMVTINALVNGQKYFFRVKAIRDTLQSDYSSTVSAIPQKELVTPDTPTGLKASPLIESIDLTWNSVKDADSYILYWSTTNLVDTTSAKLTVSVTSFRHSALDPSESYSYRVCAVNGETKSNLSSMVTETPLPKTVSELSAPQDVKASKGVNKAILDWSSVEGATAYTIYWATHFIVTENDSLIENVTAPFTHEGLTNGQTYYYRIIALNDSLKSPLSKEVQVTPDEELPRPDVPKNATAIVDNNGIVTVNCDPAANAEFYKIEVETVSGKPWPAILYTFDSVQVPFTISDLEVDTLYKFKIYGSNATGLSPGYADVNAVPQKTPVEVLWKYDTKMGGASNHTLGENGDVILSSRGALVSISNQGDELWRVENAMRAYTTPIISPNGNIIFIDSGKVVKCYSSGGSPLWDYEMGEYSRRELVIDSNNDVFIQGYRNLLSLNEHGESLWEVSYKNESASILKPGIMNNGNIAIIIPKDDMLRVYDRQGKLISSYSVKVAGDHSGISADNGVYIDELDRFHFAMYNPREYRIMDSDGKFVPFLSLNSFDVLQFDTINDRTIITAENHTRERMIAYRTSTSEELWRVKTNKYIDDFYNFTMGEDGEIYSIVIYGQLIRISPEGEVEWRYALDDGYRGDITIDSNGVIYVGSGTNLLALKSDCTGPLKGVK